jgi:hypothetical protein
MKTNTHKIFMNYRNNPMFSEFWTDRTFHKILLKGNDYFL